MKYDINKSQKLMWHCSDSDIADQYATESSLYVSHDGEYFVHGRGGARTVFAKRYEDGSWGTGEDFIPLKKDKVAEWIYDHSHSDEDFIENLRSCEKMASEYLGTTVKF